MRITIPIAAFLRRDWTTALSYRLPFVLDVTGALFSLTLFFYVSRLIDSSHAIEGSSHGYFPFVVVGLALLEVGEAGLRSFAQKLRQEQVSGTLEALLSTSTPPALIILGSAVYDLVRAAAIAVLMVLLAVVLFGLRLELDPLSLLLVAAAAGASIVLFAALGVVVAAFTVVFKQTTALIGMIIPGVALLSGVYFPLDVLPRSLRLLAEASPFAWGLEVLRGGLLSGEQHVGRLLLLVATAAAGLPLSVLLFMAALNRARRDGSLAQY